MRGVFHGVENCIADSIMEIIEVFGIHWKLLAAQAVNFTIALFVLYRFVYTPIWKILDERQKRIAKGLEDAERAAKERDEAARARESIIADARKEGGAIVEELRKQAIATEHAIVRAAQEKSAGILEEAKRRAEDERAHLLRESEKEVARMAVLAAEKILKGSS